MDEKSETAFEQAETLNAAATGDAAQRQALLDLIRLNGAITDMAATPAQLKALHTCIKKVTEDLDGMRFNTAISAMMVLVTEANTWPAKPLAVMRTFLQLLAPFAPHLAEEELRRDSLARVHKLTLDRDLQGPLETLVREHADGLAAVVVEPLVQGAAGPMVEMQKEKLRERVNAIYGYNAMSRILLTQTAPIGFAEGQAQFGPAPKAVKAAVPAAARAAATAWAAGRDCALRYCSTASFHWARKRGVSRNRRLSKSASSCSKSARSTSCLKRC